MSEPIKRGATVRISAEYPFLLPHHAPAVHQREDDRWRMSCTCGWVVDPVAFDASEWLRLASEHLGEVRGRAEMAAKLEALIQDVDAAHIPILDKIRNLIEEASQ